MYHPLLDFDLLFFDFISCCFKLDSHISIFCQKQFSVVLFNLYSQGILFYNYIIDLWNGILQCFWTKGKLMSLVLDLTGRHQQTRGRRKKQSHFHLPMGCVRKYSNGSLRPLRLSNCWCKKRF